MRVHSIFNSISGEAGEIPQGSWVTFIRLQGCNLRCQWCDTKNSHNLHDGKEMTIKEIVDQCPNKQVIITGGEPLLQQARLWELVETLQHQGKYVQIETNGSFALPIHHDYDTELLDGICWVMDYKCPSSGMSWAMFPIDKLASQIENVCHSYSHNSVYIKWVVKDLNDLDFALPRIHQLNKRVYGYVQNCISPLDGKGELIPTFVQRIQEKYPSILEDVIFSIQIHKFINLP